MSPGPSITRVGGARSGSLEESEQYLRVWSVGCKEMQRALKIVINGFIAGSFKKTGNEEEEVPAWDLVSHPDVKCRPLFVHLLYTYAKVKKKDLDSFQGVEQSIKLFGALANCFEQEGWSKDAKLYCLAVVPKSEESPPKIFRRILGGVPATTADFNYTSVMTPVTSDLESICRLNPACAGLAPFDVKSVDNVNTQPPTSSRQFWIFDEGAVAAAWEMMALKTLKGLTVTETHQEVAKSEAAKNVVRLETDKLKVKEGAKKASASYSSLSKMVLGEKEPE